MSYFRIALPELAAICQTFLDSSDEDESLTEEFSYRVHFQSFDQLHFRIEANWRKVKTKTLKSSYTSDASSSIFRYCVEGHGQITLLQDEKLLTYKGEWCDGNLKIYYMKSDLLLFICGLFLFRGVEYKLKDFQREEIRTHLSFETNAIGSIKRYLLYAPIVHGASFYLEFYPIGLPFPKIFYIHIDDRKLEEQFLLSPQLPINGIIEKVIYWDNQSLVDTEITIRKLFVTITHESREGKRSFRRKEEKRLIHGPISFFENRCLELLGKAKA